MVLIMKTFLLALLLSITTLFAQEIQYSLIDLTSDIGFEALLSDINNQGQVVGFSTQFGNAFIWENGTATIIQPDAIALAINDSGWVLVVDEFSLHLWRNGSTINIGPSPSGSQLYFQFLTFMDVNNLNNVIVPLFFEEDSIFVGYLWQSGVWSPLAQVPGFDSSVPTKINDNNDISGFYFDINEGVDRPLYWQNNNVLSFSFEGVATSLNNDLKLVGGFGSFEFGTDNLAPQGIQEGWQWYEGILDSIMNESAAVDVNEVGSIIGNSGQIFQNGSTHSIKSVLDSTGNGYEEFVLSSINDLEQIVGISFLSNSLRAILLNPILLELEITSPQAGETWIAGEQDTIRWISSELDTIEIEFSIDDGNTYETLEDSFPASSGEYIWSIPDTLLSRKCIIRISDPSLPGFDSESDLFKIKGYYLTRVTPSGDYEKFVPNEDGWKYPNDTTDIWPQQWWIQFNYDGIDPITNKPYQKEFDSINASIHPDWPLWVETCGINQCYWATDLVLYNTNSVKRWKAFNGTWGGSCYGFAASSFLGFNYKTEFLTKHPGISNYNNLFNLAIDDSIRKAVNHYYTHQKGQIPLQNDAVSISKKPWTTLAEVRQMFLAENKDIKTITLINRRPGGGGHTVAPFKIEKSAGFPGRYRVYVYDSNNPGSDTSYVLIDSTLNLWEDRLGLSWGGRTGLYLEPPVSNYLQRPVLQGGDYPILSLRGDPLMEFYTSYNSEYLMTTVSGDSVGFLGDSVVFNLEDGIPIIPKTGMPHPPIGYHIPSDEYFIYMNEFTDSSSYLTVFGDVTYDYQRNDATNIQTDRFYYNGNFSVSSDDAETKDIELSTVVEIDSSEKTIYLENTTLEQNDSLEISVQDYDKLTFKNYGAEKSYDLRSIYAVPGAGAFFLNTDISLGANTSHQIVPMWEDLVNTPVTIYVDNGIDGTIDDTLMLKNQITNVEDQGNLYIPKEYKLEQNYPNPFNPTTTIKYSIPKESFVTLKVYNLIGEEVATLVNKEQAIGNYQVEFNATSLPSGIYFARITANEFTQVVKMILLK